MANRFTIDRIIRYVLFLAIFAAIGWVVWYFSDLVIYLVIGILLAYILNPVVEWLQSFGLGRIVAIIFAYIFAVGFLSLLLAFFVPFVGDQVTGVLDLVSEEQRRNAIINSIAGKLNEYSGFDATQIRTALGEFVGNLFNANDVTTLFSSVFSIFTNIFYGLVVVPVITFFFLKDGHMIRELIFGWIPNRYFEIALGIIEKVENNARTYLRALLMQSFGVALVASIMLSIFGVEYAIVIGIFTGLANAIPYFGPTLGFMAGAIVGIAQTGDFSLTFEILIAMGVTQAVDNIFLQPYIFSRAARTHPLIILFVVLIGYRLAQVPGMLVAIPVYTILYVMVTQIMWSLRNYRIFRTA